MQQRGYDRRKPNTESSNVRSNSRDSRDRRSTGPYRGNRPPQSEANFLILTNPKELIRIPREPNDSIGDRKQSSYQAEKGNFGVEPPEKISRFSKSGENFDRQSKLKAGYLVPPSDIDRKSTTSRREPRKSTNNVEEEREIGRKSSPKGEKFIRRGGISADEDDPDVPTRIVRRFKKGGKGRSQRPSIPVKVEIPVEITTPTITVAELALKMNSKPAELVKYMMINMGVMATVTQSVDADTGSRVAEAFGKKVVRQKIDKDDTIVEAVESKGMAIDEDPIESLVPRSPIVTIMGHVDHGKTSLLDAIRSSKVASGEAGGITQTIGAYQVTTSNGQNVTFIDTPGHSAFSEMRSRGANTTDIVVLVVAADDGIKEQTVECIATAKLANVPIVVAINKMDKPEADAARVTSDLMNYGLLSTEFGGETEFGKISAKKKEGLDDLLEKILLQAEVLELKANPNRDALGVVLEAGMRQGLGMIATTLIQKGTLKIGDIFVAGEAWGKVKMLMDHTGKKVEFAGPSMPVQVVGLDGIPHAGDIFTVVDKEDTARLITESRRKLSRESQAAQMQGNLIGSIEAMLNNENLLDQKELKELSVVLRAEGPGSVSALASSLKELISEDDYFIVKCKVLTAGVGELTKSDVAIASVSNARVICFNVNAHPQAAEDARRSKIQIDYYTVVYDAINDIQKNLDSIRLPEPEGRYSGKAEVRAIFSIGKVGNIAGCEVIDGEIRKGAKARIMRMGRAAYEGRIKALRNVKLEVDTMNSGSECGIQLSDFENFVEGDVIECYIMD